MIFRVADHDTVLPLSTPLNAITGEVITNIPVSKGQNVILSIAAYNRLVQFLENMSYLKLQHKQTQVSVGTGCRCMAARKIHRRHRDPPEDGPRRAIQLVRPSLWGLWMNDLSEDKLHYFRATFSSGIRSCIGCVPILMFSMPRRY